MNQNLTKCRSIFILFLMFLFSSLAFAQTGGITGLVTDSQTGDFLPGSNIMLDGTTIGSSSDIGGKYRISNIPPGEYTLRVRYIGYEEYTTAVTVTAGRTVEVNVQLNVSYVQMQDVVVSGLRQGQVKALAVQKEANNVKNVVSREQMENFPDVNTAEVLQRLPGVHIDRSQGDGRYVLIRGTDPRLSTVTVNGEALASTRNEQRYSQLDIVGSNQMSMIEVIKAITPDMDGNSIGGSVNIITRSAFDYPGRKLNLTLGSGYAELDQAFNWQGKFNFSDKLGEDGKFGYSITANYDKKTRSADNIEYEWDEVDTETGKTVEYALIDANLMDYQLVKQRIGVGGGLEFRPDNDNRFFANMMWNKFIDENERARLRVRIDKGDFLNDDATLTKKSRMLREDNGRTENLIQTHYTLGGEHHISAMKLDYIFSYSYGEEEHPDQLDSEWDLDEKVDLDLDLSDPENFQWDVLNDDLAPGYENTAANYEFSEFDYRETFSSSENMTGAANFEVPYMLGNTAASAKIGVKYAMLTKDRKDNRYTYKWKGDGDPLLGDYLSDRRRDDFFNDNYDLGEEADHETLFDWFKANRDKDDGFKGERNYEDSDAASYEINEDVFAYYAMTDINFGPLTIVAGLRHEFTANEFKGHELLFDGDGDFASLKDVDTTRDYNNIFPMIHFKYSLTNETQFRLAFTQSMSRPNFWDLAPYKSIEPRRPRIRAGNPKLEPTTANNIDVMAEHYFRGVGLASAGFFYKDLKDIIFESTREIESGDYIGYELEQSVNGGDATLYGIELNWQQELTFLPSFLSGFGVYVNYTHIWSDADLLERKGFIPGQAGDIANLSLAYEGGGFMARLSYSYQGEFIAEVGKDEGHDEYVNSHGQLDFTASQDIISGLKLFFEAVNITNEAKYEYLGIEDRPIQVEYYSWWTRFGFKYTLN
ncbi:TonB-dependent receptor [Bacteroidota bacterium]